MGTKLEELYYQMSSYFAHFKHKRAVSVPETGWRKVPIGVYTPIEVQYPDRGIISCIFSSQKVENF